MAAVTGRDRTPTRLVLAGALLAALLGVAGGQSSGPAVNPLPVAISGPTGDAPSTPLTVADRSAAGSGAPDRVQTFRGFAAQGSANPLVDLVPELKNLPAPKWVRAGTRLNYYWASGRVPPAEGAFWPDAEGNWVDETGKRYRKDVGGGSEGVSQVTVTAAGRKTVALDSLIYLVAETGKPPTLLTGTGSVEPAGAAADYWVNSEGLAQIPERMGKNFASFRMPFTTAGKKYDALRIRFFSRAGSMTHIFDLDSGVLLHSNVITRGENGTSVSFVTYLGRRDLDIPWADADAPDWVADLQEMRYEGTQQFHVGTGQAVSAPVSLVAAVTGRGKNWMTYDQVIRSIPAQGLPEQTSTIPRSCGPAQLGAMWVPPDGLADLRRGQAIDSDPLTGMKTAVSGVGKDARGRDVVEITQDNVTQRMTFRYDVETGALVMFSRLDRRLIPSETTLVLKVVK